MTETQAMPDTEQLDRISELLNLLANQPRIVEVMARELWDYDDCAVYLKCATTTVRNKYRNSAAWPRAVGGGEMRPMYKADEVRKWAMRRKAC